MANISNINNILRVSSSGVGLNKNNTGPSELDIESAGADMIDMTRTGLKTYRFAISGSSNFSIFDVAANDDRLTISSGGDATFSGGVTAPLLTIDNTVINSNTISNASASMILDSAGDIILDADGADIILKDAGTEFGRLTNDSSNLEIKSSINDKDIIFKGVDNSSEITALTLDMSEGGNATFAGDVNLANLKSIYLGTSSALRIYTDSAVAFLRGNDVRLTNAANDSIIRVNGDVAELYHNDIKKLETTSTGVTVSGTITANSDLDQILNLNSSDSNAVYLAYQRGGVRKAYVGYGGSGNTFNIVNEISDGNISITGNDGGVSTEVLSFNVAAGGVATFESSVIAPNVFTQNIYITSSGTNSTNRIDNDGTQLYLTYGGTSSRALEILNSNGNATFAGDITLDDDLNFSTNGFADISNTGTGAMRFKPSGQTLALTLTGANATFAGSVTATTFSGDLNGTINTVTTATTKGNSTNDTTVATTAFVQNVIGTIPAGLVFQGTWNASTNTPTLSSGSGTTGHFYIVSVAGSTNLDGITDWQVGDWAVFIEQGASDQWEKIDNSSVLSGSGTGGSFAGWSGSGTSVTLGNAPVTFSGNNSTFAGTITIPEYIVHSGDTDTYFGFVTDNEYKVTVGSSTKIFADANSAYLYYQGSIKLQTTNTGVNVTGEARVYSGSSLGYFGVDTGNSYVYLGTNTSGYGLSLQTAGAEKMRIDSSGNVGIGTDSPIAKQHNVITSSGTALLLNNSFGGSGAYVDLDFNTYSVTGAGFANAAASIRVIDNGAHGGNITFRSKGSGVGASQSEIVRFEQGGNVGIGTTLPSTLISNSSVRNAAASGLSTSLKGLNIEVPAGGNSQGYVASFANTQTASNNYNAGVLIEVGSTDTTTRLLSVESGGTNRLEVRGDGNVGVGTTSPNAKIEVASGQAKTVTSGVEFARFGTSNEASNYATLNCEMKGGASAADRKWIFQTIESGVANAGNIAFQPDGGNVGIGTNAPGAKLHNYSTATSNVFISGYGTSAQNDWGASHAFFVPAENGVLISKSNAANNTNRLYTFYNDAQGNAEQYIYNTSNTATIKLDSAGDSYFNGGNVAIGLTSAGTRRLNVATSDSGNDVSFESTISRTSGSNYSIRGLANGSGATTNIGAFFEATGATTNTALWAYNGRVLLATENTTDYVGIGTAAPLSKLSINSNGAPTTSGNVATTGLTIHNGAGGTAIQIGTYDGGSYNYIQSNYVNNAGVARELRLMVGSTDALKLSTSANATFAGEITSGDDINTPTKIVIGESASPELRLKKTNAGNATLSFYNNDGTSSTQQSYLSLDANENIVLYGASGVGQYFYAGGVINETKIGANSTFAGDVSLADSKQLVLGTSGNFNMFFDGSDTTLQNFTGDLKIVNKADDKDIIFQSDNGSGGVSTYFFLDGGAADGSFLYTEFPDQSKAVFGNSQDLQLYHSGGNSYILNNTGSLIIGQTAGAIALRPVTGENGILIVENAAVTLYYDNSAKLATTSSGVSVTGTLTASADVVAYSDERLKSDIKTLDGSKVYNMRGVSFIKDNKQSSGVIAQELEEIAPELVNNDGEYKSVAYGNITGYLIEAVKELKTEIEELKKHSCDCKK